jgi:hypothetical protein
MDSGESASKPEGSAVRRARLERAAWLLLTLLVLGLFFRGIPVYFQQLQTICPAEPCYSALTAGEAQALAAMNLSRVDFARLMVAVDILTAVVNCAVALGIFWSRPDERMARYTAVTLLTFATFGIHGVQKEYGLFAQLAPWWWPPVLAVTLIGTVTISLFMFIFPDGRFVPRWLRLPVAAYLTWQVLVSLFPGSRLDYETWPVAANLANWALFFAACLYSQYYHFRYVSSYRQRQQTKWVVYGLAVAIVGAFSGYALTALAPSYKPEWAGLAVFRDSSYHPFLLLLPLSIGVAILRSGLYDIDLVINRTLVYTSLTGALALIYVGLVVVFQTLFQRLTGPAPQLAIIVSTLATVGLFQPLRRSIQGFIDRRFYRRKYDAQQVLAAFANSLRAEVDLERLTSVLLTVVEETMQPAHVSLRLREAAGPPPQPSPVGRSGQQERVPHREDR